MSAPPSILDSGYTTISQTLVTVGKEYEVHALTQFGHLSVLQIVDDLDYPAWLPAWLFEVVDHAIPSDWIANLIQDSWIVLGPPFVAATEEGYRQMVELEPPAMTMFWARLKQLEQRAAGDANEFASRA